MSRRTIVHRGEPGARLFIYCHFDPAVVRAAVAGRCRDTIVVERWGEGTSTYRPLVESYGGYEAWVADLSCACERGDGFPRVCLTTWSAGSQVAKEVCKGSAWPDAILMMDGLYGDKPKGSRPGDGQVVLDEGLLAIARYAASAARGERVMAILHSGIPTPYASSRECAAAVRRWVEKELGEPLKKDETAKPSSLGAFTGAVSLAGLHIVSFAGAGPAEHVREGKLFEACAKLWLPWLTS